MNFLVWVFSVTGCDFARAKSSKPDVLLPSSIQGFSNQIKNNFSILQFLRLGQLLIQPFYILLFVIWRLNWNIVMWQFCLLKKVVVTDASGESPNAEDFWVYLYLNIFHLISFNSYFGWSLAHRRVTLIADCASRKHFNKTKFI